MSTERDLKEIEKLKASRGWAIIQQVLQDEILAAARDIANASRMPIDEIHFRRGAIWAGSQLLDVPTKVALKLRASVALSKKPDDRRQFPDDTE